MHKSSHSSTQSGHSSTQQHTAAHSSTRSAATAVTAVTQHSSSTQQHTAVTAVTAALFLIYESSSSLMILEVAFFLLLLSMVAYGVLIIRLDGTRQFEHIVWPRPCLRKVKCSRKPWVHLRRLKRKIAREPGVKKVYPVIVCI